MNDSSASPSPEQPGQERSDNPLELKLCWCPPGKFVMGSPLSEPGRHDEEEENEAQVFVTITQGFWIGKFPVTQEQWRQVMETAPSEFEGPGRPVEMVSWEDATGFCQKLTEAAQSTNALPRGWEYRLPTEAQWEYACRAGWSTAYSFGNDVGCLSDHAWFDDNSEFTTRDVGLKRSNAWGLHDVHGNVWEWCEDWYQDELPGGDDPKVVEPSDYRVIRGGCWLVFSAICRSASRSRSAPDNRFDFLGFRVALVPSG